MKTNAHDVSAPAATLDREPAGLDPWPGRRPDRRPAFYERPGDPETAPLPWYSLLDATREHIGSEAVRLLAEQSSDQRQDSARLANELWARVRTDREAEKDLSQAGGPVALLQSVVTKLLAAGDIAATLRAHIVRAHEQLERVDRIRGAAAASPAAIAGGSALSAAGAVR